jgi:aminotransferase
MQQPHALLSQRSSHLREAGILRQLTLEVQAYADGINLGQGVCDLDMPTELRDAAARSLHHDRATYTPYAGIPEVRQAIAARMQARYGLNYGPDGVCVTVGSSMAYSATLFTFLDPGDEIILFEPFYPYHKSIALLAGAVVKTVRLGDDGAVPFDALRAQLGPRSKLVVVNTPSNPSGKVWTRNELEQLSKVLDGSSTLVVTDEIYEDLVYGTTPHVPPATIPGLFERTITISGLSKAYSITGWRIGWIAAPEVYARAIGPVFDVLCVCAPRPFQHAAAQALRTLPESWYRAQRDGYAVRRAKLADALAGGGFTPHLPQGAYYMTAGYEQVYGAIAPREACMRLLREHHLAAIPSSIFYDNEATCPRFLRFQFAVESPVLEEAARRLRRATP